MNGFYSFQEQRIRKDFNHSLIDLAMALGNFFLFILCDGISGGQS